MIHLVCFTCGKYAHNSEKYPQNKPLATCENQMATMEGEYSSQSLNNPNENNTSKKEISEIMPEVVENFGP